MAGTEILLRVRDYDLAATLDSGQAFRWQRRGNDCMFLTRAASSASIGCD